MNKTKRTTIAVQGVTIAVQNRSEQDYISLTDIARYRNSQEPFAIINNWMRSRSTIEFLGLWEKLSNPDFKPLEFERFRTPSLSAKDCPSTSASPCSTALPSPKCGPFSLPAA